MPMFGPKPDYVVVPKAISIKEFYEYSEEFVVRPPYQRKSVWGTKKQQALLDSLLRQYYVPRIVLREIRLDNDKKVLEVIDGQQRIDTVQSFFSDNLKLPSSLEDLSTLLPNAKYSSLPSEMRRFVDRIDFDADIVGQIDNPRNPDHQYIATEIFWRLQQGESLTYMEVAHSRLSSLSRNFVVKYADDQRFDYENYKPLDTNPDKHDFFRILERSNNRMQHLALLTRFLLLEEKNGPTDIKDTEVMNYIDEYKHTDGIGNYSFEQKSVAQQVLQTLNLMNDLFQNDPMVKTGGTVKELKTEYFIISLYLLVRHLRKNYVIGADEKRLIFEFAIHFHERWRSNQKENDLDILLFSENRQQTSAEIQKRHIVMRQLFFEFVNKENQEILTKDDRRVFNEAERIRIYRRDKGLCQICLAEGKPEAEARVPWEEYDADHVLPHSQGGRTSIENARVLCQYHNRSATVRQS